MKMKGLVILLVASVTLCNAGHKKKNHRRGLHFDEISTGYEPSEHELPSPGWNSDVSEWDSDPSEWNSDVEESADEEEPIYGQHQEAIEPETWDEDLSHGWSGASKPLPIQSWQSAHLPKWKSKSHSHSHVYPAPKSVKTVVKKVPVPYERPIKVENPVYTPVEKHIPIENHVTVVKYIEKPVPKYVDNPVPVPVVKEEHIPQPYDQKVKVIVQKVYVHVPVHPHPPKHTIIIRKKIHPNQHNLQNNNNKHKLWGGFL